MLQDNFTGNISSRLKGIIDGYDKLWSEIKFGSFMSLCKIIIAMCVLFIFNKELALFILIWGVAYFFIMYHLSKKLNALSFAVTESKHTIMGQVADSITNIIAVFSYATRKQELNQLSQQVTKDFIPKSIRSHKAFFKVQIIGASLYIIKLFFALFYISYLKINGIISTGDFILLLGMILSLEEHLWYATVSLQKFMRQMGEFKSSLSILNTPQKNVDLPAAQPLVMEQPTIAFHNVSFSYDDDELILDQLNLNVKAGEKIGLVGESGAGKSSLISLLLKYFFNDNGSIEVSGQNIQQVTQDSLRAHIGVIPQDAMLFHRTIMENIRYGNLNATDEEVIAASQKAHIHDHIMSLPGQYHTEVGERGIKLSGGQRQRIAIARALLKDAPIFILDEATSALDSHTEQLIQESLNIFMTNKEKTVIAIAHRLSTLKHMDRILVLDKGVIIEEGTHDQLVTNEGSVYQQLWQYQAT